MMTDPVETKFTPPQSHQHIVLRQRLIDELKKSLQSVPLTLVTAPAGSGKTTLLASFTRLPDGLPVAWFSIDPEDSEPKRFTRGLFRAIGSVYQEDMDAMQQALSYIAVEPRQAVAQLINVILETHQEPFLLIIDDLHWISEPSVFALLNYLLDHQPPQMHILLAGRYEPPLSLARFRVRRQLAELNLTRLAFTPDEIEMFLRQVIPLHEANRYIDVIYQHTQGWAAGIILAAGILVEETANDAGRQSFLNLLARSNRLIFDFLAEEILNLQQPDMRNFLLDISILSEITVEAAAKLTGREDTFALLDEIYRHHLFLTLFSDASGQPVYRYHDLFAAFLRERLLRERPSRMRELHRRAAEITSRIEEQISHWLAAGEWDTAAHLIVTKGEELIQLGAIAPVRQWITALPEAVRIQYPRLVLLLGVCAAESWELDTAVTLLRQAVSLLADEPTYQGTALLQLANALSTSGSISVAIIVSEQALQHPLSPRQRANLLITRAWQAVAAGDNQTVTAFLDEALALMEQSGDDQALRGIISQYHVQFTFYENGIERTWRFCRLAGKFARYPLDLLNAASLTQQGWLYLWSGDWNNSLARLKSATAINEQSGTLVWLDISIKMLQCIHLGLSGREDQGQTAFHEFFEHLQLPEMSRFSREWLPLFQFIAARIYWTTGRKEEAVQLYRAMSAVSGGWSGLEHLTRWLHALLLIDEADNRGAEAILQEAVAIQQANPALRLAGDARAWLAYWHVKQENGQAAVEHVSSFLDDNYDLIGRIRYEGAMVAVPLLRLAVRQGVHVDLARRTLALLVPPESGTYTVPETGEILTPREVEVLQLVAQGATNPEIAGSLTISIHTVKIHMAHLLAKLNVTSRTAAALRAREMGLSPSQ